jgi:hypothetical protein
VDDVFAITADSSQLNSVFAHPHIIKRVIAQFRLCRSTGGNRQLVIRFAKHTLPDTPEKIVPAFLIAHQRDS